MNRESPDHGAVDPCATRSGADGTTPPTAGRVANTPACDLDFAALLTQGWIAHGEHHTELDSTNNRARHLATDPHLPLPHLVVADQQTAGRGRGSNRWWTGAGSLALSVVLNPADRGIPRSRWGMISLATAVAIVDVVQPRLPAWNVGLHWPNDVFVGFRKLAGILVEGLPDGRQIVGIGLNCDNTLEQAPDEVRQRAVSLRDLLERPQPRGEVLADLLDRLNDVLRQLADEPDSIGRRMHQLCLQVGQVLVLETGVESYRGWCRGVARDGALLLEIDGTIRPFYAGVLRHDLR